jgi:hypothetical protein
MIKFIKYVNGVSTPSTFTAEVSAVRGDFPKTAYGATMRPCVVLAANGRELSIFPDTGELYGDPRPNTTDCFSESAVAELKALAQEHKVLLQKLAQEWLILHPFINMGKGYAVCGITLSAE